MLSLTIDISLLPGPSFVLSAVFILAVVSLFSPLVVIITSLSTPTLPLSSPCITLLGSCAVKGTESLPYHDIGFTSQVFTPFYSIHWALLSFGIRFLSASSSSAVGNISSLGRLAICLDWKISVS